MFLLIPFRNSSATIVVDTLNSIMFLLILLLTCIYELIPCFKFHYVSINSNGTCKIKAGSKTFKFHYVSINSFSFVFNPIDIPAFKFHYVSINSTTFSFMTCFRNSSLNSIMFLLIHFVMKKLTTFLNSLNSIMFLLIQNFIRAIIIRKVTLNSIMFLLILVHSVLGAWIYLFKFHYVSINSCMRQIAMDTRFSLNSIMFLLIQVVERWTLKHFQTLNSIMFLLIHVLASV